MAVPLTGLPPLPLGLIWCTAHENARIRAPAAAAAISFGHEMNGYWYPWGFTGTTAAQFVAAWRRIHGLFAAAGASNVIWVWNPNVISAEPQLELSAYYPGDGTSTGSGSPAISPPPARTHSTACTGRTCRRSGASPQRLAGPAVASSSL